jgi:hypothetical protein
VKLAAIAWRTHEQANASSAPILRQRKLAGEPELDRATANDNDVKFLVHGEYSYSAATTRWPASSGMAELNVLSGS